ncbi:MAG: GTP-binding protein Rho1 [Alectoria sarmentosa]|nr:MAG: GTP-binding protein Rho1 [Alectoria sarmentosa]
MDEVYSFSSNLDNGAHGIARSAEDMDGASIQSQQYQKSHEEIQGMHQAIERYTERIVFVQLADDAVNPGMLADSPMPISKEIGSLETVVEELSELIDCLWSLKPALILRASISDQAALILHPKPPLAQETLQTKTKHVGAEASPETVQKIAGHRENEKRHFEKRINTHLTYLEPPPPYSHSPEKVKMVVVGDGNCGKTAAALGFIHGKVDLESYVPTVIDDYTTSCGNVELDISDTAGQEDYDRVRPLSYPDSHLAVICFSISAPDTLQNLRDKWVLEIKHFLNDVPIVVAGLKSDLRDLSRPDIKLELRSQPPTTYAEGLTEATDLGAAAYVECSARDQLGLRELFHAAADVGACYRKRQRAEHRRPRDCVLM